MAADERKWRAEGIVRDAFMTTPEAKAQVKAAMREMMKVEKKIKHMVKK